MRSCCGWGASRLLRLCGVPCASRVEKGARLIIVARRTLESTIAASASPTLKRRRCRRAYRSRSRPLKRRSASTRRIIIPRPARSATDPTNPERLRFRTSDLSSCNVHARGVCAVSRQSFKEASCLRLFGRPSSPPLGSPSCPRPFMPRNWRRPRRPPCRPLPSTAPTASLTVPSAKQAEEEINKTPGGVEVVPASRLSRWPRHHHEGHARLYAGRLGAEQVRPGGFEARHSRLGPVAQLPPARRAPPAGRYGHQPGRRRRRLPRNRSARPTVCRSLQGRQRPALRCHDPGRRNQLRLNRPAAATRALPPESMVAATRRSVSKRRRASATVRGMPGCPSPT